MQTCSLNRSCTVPRQMLSLPSHSVRSPAHNAHNQPLPNSLICTSRGRCKQIQPLRPSPWPVGRCTGLVVRGSNNDLEKQLDLTQKTLERALQQFEAAAQTQPASKANDDVLSLREQQLWDRQQAMLDRMQQHWDLERQAWTQKEASWHLREQQLLSELDHLRKELQTLLTSAAAAAAAASYPQTGSSAAAAATITSSSSSSRPGASDTPGVAAVISGPSSASAAVASAIRAVRDAHVNPASTDTTAAAAATGSGNAPASGSDSSPWEHLFTTSTAASSSSSNGSSSSSTAVNSVTAAIAAVDLTDVLTDMDLDYKGPSSSSSRGRRRVQFAAAGSSNGSSSSSSSDNTTTTTPSSSSSLPVETVKGDPSGPPPLLSVGDDDIFWVSKLHNALVTAGFYPSDDEIENWMFAEGTQSALMTFQACNGVTETGTTCEMTWRKLLGEDHYEQTYGSSSSSFSTLTVTPSGGAAAAAAGSSNGVMVQEEEETVTFSFSSSSGGSSSSRWPVLMDMDGGKEVHALQVLLGKAGFFCGDDEMRWWQFGSTTTDALKTFQACQGLPESGVCDERTWLALLGDDSSPEDLENIRGVESSYEDDMTAPHDGAVWLLGEQRWSRPVNGTETADDQ